MQPQQPQPNFDFIMNPSAPPKQKGPLGNSMASRLLVVIGLAVVIIVIISVVFKFATSSGGLDKAAMLSVAQDQVEISRIADLGKDGSTVQSVKNFTITAKLGVTSDNKKLLAYLAEAGYTPSPESLLLKQSLEVDTRLTDAKSSSTFDTVYRGVMKEALETYKNDLGTAYNGAGDKGKAVLQESYGHAELLLTQLNSPVTSK